jgi:hypothetical protein
MALDKVRETGGEDGGAILEAPSKLHGALPGLLQEGEVGGDGREELGGGGGGDCGGISGSCESGSGGDQDEEDDGESRGGGGENWHHG